MDNMVTTRLDGQCKGMTSRMAAYLAWSSSILSLFSSRGGRIHSLLLALVREKSTHLACSLRMRDLPTDVASRIVNFHVQFHAAKGRSHVLGNASHIMVSSAIGVERL